MVKVCTNREYVRPFQTEDGRYIYDHQKALKSQGFYMDGYLKSNIDNYLIPAVKAKWDNVNLVTGLEGSGKTSIASSICHYIDQSFNLDRVCFTVEHLMEQIDTCPKGSSIMYDEAVSSMLGQDASSNVSVNIVKKFVVCRKKNLFIFLLIPNLFLLRRYFSILRTRNCIHCFSPDGINRGFFKFFGPDTKRRLYLRGFKEMDMSAVKPDFMGRFTNTWGCFFDANAYEAKKDAMIESLSRSSLAKDKVSVSTERAKNERNVALLAAFKFAQSWYDLQNPGLAMKKPLNDSRFSKLILERLQWKISAAKVHSAREAATGFLEEYWKQIAAGVKIDEAFGDLSSLPASEKDRIKEESKEEEVVG